MQLYDRAPRTDWNLVCRESFGLRPQELAVLCSVIAYGQAEGAPMPRGELQRVARTSDGIYHLESYTAPRRLVRIGLIAEYGPTFQRCYSPTAAGLRRVRG